MAARLFSVSLLVLLSCQSAYVFANTSKLEEVCNNVSGWYITPQHCHSILDTDSHSRTADMNGIGIIATDIAAKNATLVLRHMLHLFKATTDPLQQKALRKCVQVYRDVIPALNAATESIKNKKYSDAASMLNEALGVPEKCDLATANYPTIRTLVDKDDISFSNVVSVAHAVAEYLANYSSS